MHTTTYQPTYCWNLTFVLSKNSTSVNANNCPSFAPCNSVFYLFTLRAKENKKKGEKKDEVEKGKAKEKQGKESVLVTDTLSEHIIQQPPEDQSVELAVMNIYAKLLHKKASHSIVFPYSFYFKKT